MLDPVEIARQMKELQVKAEKYDNIKVFIEDKSTLINQKIDEIKSILNEINPSIIFKDKKHYESRREGLVPKVIVEVVNYLRENKVEISSTEIKGKWNITSGGTTQKILTVLKENKNIKVRLDPNYKKRCLFSYNFEKIDFKGTITEKVKQEPEKRVDIIEENKELLKSMPKKYSYIG